MSQAATKKSPKKLTISQKLAQLDESVEWFYGDEFALDRALEKYKSANQLATEIAQDLSELKNQVEIIEDFTKS